MSRISINKSIGLFIILWISISGHSYAFTLNGASDSRGWDSTSVSFHINTENCPSNIRTIVEDSLSVWNNVPTSNLKVSVGDDTSESLATVSGGSGSILPAIFCYTSMSSISGIDADSIPGFATGQKFDGDGHITYGYIILNMQANAKANISTLDSTLVKVVLAHEIGHALGLGHSEDTHALMYYDGSAKKNLSLAKDDQDGLSYLYPRDELGKDKMLGCSTIQGLDRKTTQNPLVFIAMLCVPFLTLVGRVRKQSI